jgi:hypothetical protein
MSEAPGLAKVPSDDALNPDVLPDEPLEIVFAEDSTIQPPAPVRPNEAQPPDASQSDEASGSHNPVEPASQSCTTAVRG